MAGNMVLRGGWVFTAPWEPGGKGTAKPTCCQCKGHGGAWRWGHVPGM